MLSALMGFALKLQCYTSNPFALFTDVLRTCYSDVTALYGARDFDIGIIPYFEIQSDGLFLEYPVLIGIQMYFTSILSNLIQPGSFLVFTYINWFIALVFLLIAVWYLDKINQRAARWFAYSPALIFVLGINWDALAVMLMILGLYFYTKNQNLHMGIALGLGMSAKLFPILMLPIAIIFLYQNRNIRGIVLSVAGALGSWLLVNGAFILFAFEGWIRFFDFSRGRPIDFGSPYLALRFLLNIDVSTEVANTLGLLSVLASYVFIVMYRDRLSLEVALTLVLGVFVLMNKVYSPQFWIWLAPLFSLVITKRWNWIQWNGFQVLYYFAIWAYLASYENLPYALSAKVYAVFILLHFLSTCVAVGYVVTTTIRNQPQPVRDQSHL
jgi:uncharacterized membrane protein